MKDKPKCLRPGCESSAKVRGLCGPCYSQANIAVRMNLTTWGELIANGKVLPIRRPGNHGVVKEWLLAKPSELPVNNPITDNQK